MALLVAMNPDLARAADLAVNGQGDDAREIVQRLAEGGDPEALYTWADMNWKGILVETDWKAALAHFLASEAAGHPIAGHIATDLMALGAGGPRDWPRAMHRLADEATQYEHRASALRLIEAMDLDDAGDQRVRPQGEALRSAPEIHLFAGLLSPEECAYLRALGEPHLGPSLVTAADLRQVPDPIRTSECATYLYELEDPVVTALNRRIAAATGSDAQCGEALLLLRYSPGQHYLNHVDALPGLANQRVMTALVYLNQDYLGGQTAFPAIGFTFRGKTGDALVFRNVGKDGRSDPQSLHAGWPVEIGRKYLATRWIRERPMMDANGPFRD